MLVVIDTLTFMVIEPATATTVAKLVATIVPEEKLVFIAVGPTAVVPIAATAIIEQQLAWQQPATKQYFYYFDLNSYC
jgi:hypothetical protein